jgi:hypothetical protein
MSCFVKKRQLAADPAFQMAYGSVECIEIKKEAANRGGLFTSEVSKLALVYCASIVSCERRATLTRRQQSPLCRLPPDR